LRLKLKVHGLTDDDDDGVAGTRLASSRREAIPDVGCWTSWSSVVAALDSDKPLPRKTVEAGTEVDCAEVEAAETEAAAGVKNEEGEEGFRGVEKEEDDDEADEDDESGEEATEICWA